MFNSSIWPFIGLVGLLTITPGADTMLVIRNVLSRGQRAGLVTTLGISSGLFFHATLSALGLSLILVRSAEAFEVVKLAGAGYLVLLGIQSLARARSRAEVVEESVGSTIRAGAQWRNSYAEGLLTNVLNPKVAVFYLALLPQFVAPTDPVLVKSLLLAGIHVVLGLIWLPLVVLFVGRMARILSQPAVRKKMELLSGAIMIALGVRLALERK